MLILEREDTYPGAAHVVATDVPTKLVPPVTMI